MSVFTERLSNPSMDLYRKMLVVRMLEDRLQVMCREGKAGDLHFSKGQEAIAVGVCAALRPTDHIATHHRTICHAVAKGADLYRLVAELLGRRTGYNGGRAGEMHINIPEVHFDFSFQLVGTCLPVAAGIAWALRYHRKTDDVVAVFFGDAASSNGAVHEGLTIAAVRRVPLLLVCENNGRAGNVTQEHYLPVAGVVERMGAYGLRGATVDGNDVEAVRGTAAGVVEYVRRTSRPMLLECFTERLSPHKQGMSDLRSKEVLVELAKDDPLLRCAAVGRRAHGHEARRRDDGVSADERAALEREIGAELDAVFERVALDPVADFP